MCAMNEQEDLFEVPTFGTDPKKLARRHDPHTSKAAAHATNTGRWERRVLNIIKEYGSRGCIQSEVLARVRELYGNDVDYSTVTARFKALEEKGLIEYTGETRKGTSGRQSRVRRATNRPVR